MSDAVVVTTTVRFKPFSVPAYVGIEMPPRPRQEGLKELPTIAVEDLEPDVLDALAERWLDNLYASAKRGSPFRLPLKADPA